MAQFTVKIMCPSARGPPATVREFYVVGTKCSAQHKAAFVPRNKSRQFAELEFVKDAARVGLRFDNAVQRDFLNQWGVLSDGGNYSCVVHGQFSFVGI